MKIKKVERKAMKIRYSGRSSDYITPSFGFGCVFSCSYCYMRRHTPENLSVATNHNKILDVINEHFKQLPSKKPNQTHKDFWTYDISCNEDFAAHTKYHDWKQIFKFFIDTPGIMATFATKFVNKDLLQVNPNKKVRIRFSLMPQEWSDILEPNTSKIIDRIKAIELFYNAGYDVHINFSPIVLVKESKKLYSELFTLINDIVPENIKKDILSECIMLTHSEKMHAYNLKNNSNQAEELLWNPKIQESKTSSFSTTVNNAIRYERNIKANQIKGFTALHHKIIPWNKIRYIF